MKQIATAIPPPSSKDELNATWHQVEERVLQMVGGDRSKVKTGLSIDDVLTCLDDVYKSGAEDGEKYSSVRKIFDRTLQCIQTVGGVVASEASWVFPPSTACFNVLNMVIQAWQGFQEAFESLAALLERCSEFLDRLTYYAQSPSMDAKLTKVACQHLHLFVEICERSLQLKKKRNMFKAFFKAMFLEDPEMQDLLQNMERLINKEHGLVMAQTWKTSNEAAENSRDGLNLTRKLHNNFLDDKTELKREKDLQRWRLAVVDALECDRKIVLSQDNPEPWERAWKKHKGKLIEGSGSWLFEHPHYKSWMSTEPGADSSSSDAVLGIEGADGSGKTLLASNVILNLRKPMGQVATGNGRPRVLVAHSFLDFNTNNSKAPQSDMNAATILKHVLCQLALSHEAILKSMASACEGVKEFSNTLDMWNKLVLENTDLANMEMDFFIVWDGLVNKEDVEVVGQLLQRFSLANERIRRKFRFLITGPLDTFRGLASSSSTEGQREAFLQRPRTLSLGHINLPDVQLFINHRIANMDNLKDETRRGVQDIRRKITEELAKSTAGDFYKIDRILDNISKTDDIDEINGFLHSATQARPDQIEADIDMLNRSRTPREIAEINELILWIDNAYQLHSPEVYEVIFSLQNWNTGNSLTSLRSKIESKYTILGLDEGHYVTYKIWQIQDMIPIKNYSAENKADSETIIHPSEIAIVKHYLSTICPKDLYERFGFDDFFQQKQVHRGDVIQRDPDNAHLKLAIRCMQALKEKRTDKYSIALNFARYWVEVYARTFLAIHLTDTDLSLAARSLKSETGEQLVELFLDPVAILSLLLIPNPVIVDLDDEGLDVRQEENLNVEDIPPCWESWIYGKKGISAVMTWFTDNAVIEKVKGHEVITKFVSAAESERAFVLFRPGLKAIAQRIFQEPSTSKKEMWRGMTVLASILRAKSKVVATDTESFPVQDNDKTVTVDMEGFDLVEAWAQEELNVTIKDDVWETQAALLLSSLGSVKASAIALARAKAALEMNTSNENAMYVLSKVTGSSDESIDLLEKLLEQGLTPFLESIKTNKTMPRDQICTRACHLARVILDLGDRYWAASSSPTQLEGSNTGKEPRDEKYYQTKAIEVYDLIFMLPPSYGILRHLRQILQKYSRAGKIEEILATFEKILRLSGPKNVNEISLNHASAKKEDSGVNTIVVEKGEASENANAAKSNAAGVFLKKELMYEGYTTMRNALIDVVERFPNRFDLVEDCFKQAMSEVDPKASSDRFWLLYRKAGLLTKIDGHLEEERSIWEELLLANDREDMRSEYVENLVLVLKQLVMHADEQDGDSDKYRQRIEELFDIAEKEEKPLRAVSYRPFLSYCSERGDVARTKRIIQFLLRDALDMLADDQVDNDGTSLWHLNMAFSVSRDFDNLFAVFEMACQSRRAEWVEYRRQMALWNKDQNPVATTEEDEASSVNGDKDSGQEAGVADAARDHAPEDVCQGVVSDQQEEIGSLWRRPKEEEITSKPDAPSAAIVYCDGTCGREFPDASGVWHCLTDAGDIQFDDECYQKLQQGNLRARGCSKDHDFIQFPVRDEKRLATVPKGSMLVGEKVMTIQQWKDSIADKYLKSGTKDG